eukprot:352048-Chlamydomonas_euryale.AAC.6
MCSASSLCSFPLALMFGGGGVASAGGGVNAAAGTAMFSCWADRHLGLPCQITAMVFSLRFIFHSTHGESTLGPCCCSTRACADLPVRGGDLWIGARMFRDICYAPEYFISPAVIKWWRDNVGVPSPNLHAACARACAWLPYAGPSESSERRAFACRRDNGVQCWLAPSSVLAGGSGPTRWPCHPQRSPSTTTCRGSSPRWRS